MRRAAVILAIVLTAHAASAQTSGYTLARKPRMGLVLTARGWRDPSRTRSKVRPPARAERARCPLASQPNANIPAPLDATSVDCQSFALDGGLVAVGLVQVAGAALLAAGLVPREVRTKVTVTPTFGWSHGPHVGFSARF